MICKYFLLICGLSFWFAFCFLCYAKASELSLSRSYWFIFAFWVFSPLFWEMYQKRYCCDLCQHVLPLLSSRSFIVSGLMFRFLIHSELVFVDGVKGWSNFIILYMVVQFSQPHLLKRQSFQHCAVLPPLL